jgi:hypothetical protein
VLDNCTGSLVDKMNNISVYICCFLCALSEALVVSRHYKRDLSLDDKVSVSSESTIRNPSQSVLPVVMEAAAASASIPSKESAVSTGHVICQT